MAIVGFNNDELMQEIKRLEDTGKLPPLIRNITIEIGVDKCVTIYCESLATEEHLKLIGYCLNNGVVKIDGMGTKEQTNGDDKRLPKAGMGEAIQQSPMEASKPSVQDSKPAMR